MENTIPISKPWGRFQSIDPRIPVAIILFTYLSLGLTILGFNRTPLQALTTTITCVLFELALGRIFKKQWLFPLSAMITSFSLSFLLNYSHDFFLLFIPIFFAIGSKYIFTFNGKHTLNPALMGVSLSLIFSKELVTAAPAYQWNGIAGMSFFVAMLGLLFVIPRVNRHWLVISFLTFFTLQTALRAYVMRHHLPFETLFLGTLSSPSFLIFTFFMITDPPTTPNAKREQIWVGFWLATIDLAFHLVQSYYTFFYAALVVGSIRLFWKHFKVAQTEGLKRYVLERFWKSHYYKKLLTIGIIYSATHLFYVEVVRPNLKVSKLDWKFELIPSSVTGLNADKYGGLIEELDPRMQHIGKWVLSVGDAVAISDVDGDNLQDIFLTNPLKESSERAALYKNLGSYKFQRIPLPALDRYAFETKKYGIITNAIFVDFDNSGVQSLFLTVAFGRPILLKNRMKETGKLDFEDVSDDVGFKGLYTNSLAATFADFNGDGLLDLFVANVWPENLPDYPEPKKLNIFNLPKEEYPGDLRPYNFMHASWHMADNGGQNLLFLQSRDHKFVKMDSKAWGLPETRWSLIAGSVDFNKDGWPDLYVANDFGPDDLYYNHNGQYFENIKGTMFGSIGKDTYKGMNVSIGDFNRTGWMNVYVSNVHHALQAEGSLLWDFSPGKNSFYPTIRETATDKGVLNENRFGWGGVATDFDNSGWLDIAQANGMVDDKIDKKFDQCPDYWYINEKVARSPPSFHRYINRWGDLRGYCIYGNEKNRLYLNLGSESRPQFVDVAEQVGLNEITNSRGAAVADFENRGRMDLIFTHQFAKPSFYKNVVSINNTSQNSWIGIDIESNRAGCNREAIGTRVRLEIEKNNGDKFSMTHEKQSVSGFSAQSDKRLHFGLGKDVKSVTATIDWCLRSKQIVADLKLNEYTKIIWN
jgi:hypothetical protein